MAKTKKIKDNEVDSENEQDEGETETPQMPPAPTTPMSYEEKRLRTRDVLNAQPKVSMMIPLLDKEKEGSTEVVVINGYSYIIKKGERVDVPEAVANILDERFKTLSQLGKTAGVEGQDVRLAAAEARMHEKTEE